MGDTSSVLPGIGSSSTVANSKVPNIVSPFFSSSSSLIGQVGIEEELRNINQQILAFSTNMQEIKKQIQLLTENVQLIVQSTIVNTGLQSSKTNQSTSSTQIAPFTQSFHQQSLMSPQSTNPQLGPPSFNPQPVSLSTNPSPLTVCLPTATDVSICQSTVTDT